MMTFDLRDILSRIDIDEGRYVLLVDIALEKADSFRNIFMLSKTNEIIWQVHSDFDDERSGYFTGIEYQDGVLRGWRFDGMVYTIDLVNGWAIPERVVK